MKNMPLMENKLEIAEVLHETTMEVIKNGYCLEQVPLEEELRIAFASMLGTTEDYNLNATEVTRAVAIVREWYYRAKFIP